MLGHRGSWCALNLEPSQKHGPKSPARLQHVARQGFAQRTWAFWPRILVPANVSSQYKSASAGGESTGKDFRAFLSRIFFESRRKALELHGVNHEQDLGVGRVPVAFGGVHEAFALIQRTGRRPRSPGGQ